MDALASIAQQHYSAMYTNNNTTSYPTPADPGALSRVSTMADSVALSRINTMASSTAKATDSLANGLTRKYVCSLCTACRPTKRSNIQSHIWMKHSNVHGGNSYLHRYRAQDHKHLVDAYVREVVVPDSPSPQDDGDAGETDDFGAPPSPLDAAHHYSSSTGTSRAESSLSASRDPSMDLGHHRYIPQPPSHNTSDMPAKRVSSADRHPPSTIRGAGIGKPSHPGTSSAPALVRRLLSHTDTAGRTFEDIICASPSLEGGASTPHGTRYVSSINPGEADASAVLSALVELLDRGEIEIVSRHSPSGATARTSNNTRRHSQQQHVLLVSSPPTAALSSAPPPAHLYRCTSSTQQQQPRPQQRDLLSVLLEMPKVNSAGSSSQGSSMVHDPYPPAAAGSSSVWRPVPL